ncbi:hypothetical protein ACFYXD_35330 [Streptomyces platensis]|uniref:hypothetical protein n=1 Tax=Streptomyces platensis TaxID=58346 RepID=UPI0036978B83
MATSAAPQPARSAKFFQPGHTYASLRFRFHCGAVAPNPATGETRAIGWHGRLRTGDGEWLWTASERTLADWSDGHWTDITENGDGR